MRSVIVAELWAPAIDVVRPAHALADAALAIGPAEHLADLDRRGELGPLFAPALEPDELVQVEREEGWILGA